MVRLTNAWSRDNGIMFFLYMVFLLNYLLNSISQSLVASASAFPFDIKSKPCSSLMCLYPLLFPLVALSLLHFKFAAFALSHHSCPRPYLSDCLHHDTLPVSSSSGPVLPTCYCPNDLCSSISLLTLQYHMGFLFSEESSSLSLFGLGV